MSNEGNAMNTGRDRAIKLLIRNHRNPKLTMRNVAPNNTAFIFTSKLAGTTKFLYTVLNFKIWQTFQKLTRKTEIVSVRVQLAHESIGAPPPLLDDDANLLKNKLID